MSRRQAERSETTRGDLLRVARELFTAEGYAGTSLGEVAERAGVTKGALYHHFRNKQELFQACFEQLEKELCDKVVVAAAEAGSDVLEGIRLGIRAFLESAGEEAAQRIVLIEGPSVLGWEKWREIDEHYGFGIVKASIEAAMDSGVLARRPVDPLAHLFLAALSEAAMQIARAEDQKTAMDELSSALWIFVESLRARV